MISMISMIFIVCPLLLCTFYSKIRKSTVDFFGVGEEEDQAVLLNRKWTQRQQRHYSRRYGQLKPEVAAGMETADVVDAAPGSVTSEASSTGHNFKRRKSRKESVSSMAWKGLRHRVLVCLKTRSIICFEI